MLFSATLLAAFFGLWAQIPPPGFPPSYEVHITSSATRGKESSSGPRHFLRRGFDLKSILAELYGVNPSRVLLPAALANGDRYDFALVLPKEEREEEMKRRVLGAIQNRFHLAMAFETRPENVYILTAPNGVRPSMVPSDEDTHLGLAQMTMIQRDSSQGAAPATSITTINAGAVTMEHFCAMLESGLGRMVIDETHLTGSFAIEVRGAHTTEEFLQQLDKEYGLLVTPGRRNVKMLVVHPT